MERNYNSAEYISSLGEELVFEFARSGKTTHPHAVSGGRENSVKNKLKDILPYGVGIGSGFVVDSYGNTSNQCDIILYEEQFALKFTENNDMPNTYYNCENVIAIGEIKSELNKKELNDSINKLKKIKSLIRYGNKEKQYRPYFTPFNLPSTSDYNQYSNQYHQIFTFIICKNVNVSFETITKNIKSSFEEKNQYFNAILSLNDGYLGYYDPKKKGTTASDIEATHFYLQKDNIFNKFISDLIHFIEFGGSVYCPKSRYFRINEITTLHNIKLFSL